MKKLWVILIPFFFICAQSITFYGDWGWGYYFWIGGPIGPVTSNGMAAAGYSGGIEYRGFSQFSMYGWPGQGTEITSLVLRLRNNTSGAGLQIDINRVTSATPGWDECGGTSPIYLTHQEVTPNAEDYNYFDLSGTSATDDLLGAWQGSSWFGFGYKGARGSAEPCMHFFYSFWADPMYDAALLVNYTVGTAERIGDEVVAPVTVHPNPFSRFTEISIHSGRDIRDIRIYSSQGRCVRCFSGNHCESCVVWDGSDHRGQSLPAGVYFIMAKGQGFEEAVKVVLLR